LLVWAASYDRAYVMANGIGKRVLAWVGTRSYALYLLHVPVFYLTHTIWESLVPQGTRINEGGYTLHLVATAAVLAIGLSELNYRLVEVPLRRHGAAIAAKIRAPSNEPRSS
jgi:peptidoglycan/LPS O-acetylase OafA/YrhL